MDDRGNSRRGSDSTTVGQHTSQEQASEEEEQAGEEQAGEEQTLHSSKRRRRMQSPAAAREPPPREPLSQKHPNNRKQPSSQQRPVNGVPARQTKPAAKSAVIVDPREPAHTPPADIIQKDPVEAYHDLNGYMRTHYIAGFPRNDVHLPVKLTYPMMKKSHPEYRTSLARVKGNFKNWKSRSVEAAYTWVSNYMASTAEGKLRREHSFKTLKTMINARYQVHWPAEVFRFADGAVDWDKVSPKGQHWLRCEYLHRPLYLSLT